MPISACEEENKQERAEILADFPGVVCWGDSLTAGAGGNGTDYPGVLEELIHKNVFRGIEVVNLGVGGEGSDTICARAGVYEPLALTQAVILPASSERVEIKLNFPVLRQGKEWFNPCSIQGLLGEIEIEQTSDNSQDSRYYFKRK
ncbi:MAG: SGNH/GDSL hydrolase family protein, partial [Clostridia bacterium]|nr:SGNH/GDSL hydrolase family protein [Clostridia bacterium]